MVCALLVNPPYSASNSLCLQLDIQFVFTVVIHSAKTIGGKSGSEREHSVLAPVSSTPCFSTEEQRMLINLHLTSAYIR